MSPNKIYQILKNYYAIPQQVKINCFSPKISYKLVKENNVKWMFKLEKGWRRLNKKEFFLLFLFTNNKNLVR